MDMVRIGIIGGTRGFGLGRAKAFHADPRAQVVAVSARTQSKVESVAAEFGARGYADWHDLIAADDVDAVGIAVPNALHFELARAALEAGKHTIVEYPICQTLEELDELLAIAAAGGVVLHHGLTVRGERLHRKVKELVPRLGRLFHAHYRYFGGGTWYLDPALRGDAFMALHIHFIDQFEDVMGETMRLNATLKVVQEGDTNIHSGAVLQEFAGGSNAFQEFGMGYGVGPTYQGWYAGENGWLQFEGRKEVRLVLRDGADEVIKTDPVDVVADDTANFVAQVLDGAESWVPVEQTRRAMQLCLAAAESARTGKKRDVSP